MFYWDIQQINYEYDRIPSRKTETWTFKDLIDDIVNFNTNVRKSSLSKLLSVTLSDKMKPQISTHDLGQLKIYLVRDMLLRQDFREKVQSY